jgi:hypothetical protein
MPGRIARRGAQPLQRPAYGGRAKPELSRRACDATFRQKHVQCAEEV